LNQPHLVWLSSNATTVCDKTKTVLLVKVFGCFQHNVQGFHRGLAEGVGGKNAVDALCRAREALVFERAATESCVPAG
jgi:hypothetical protein